MLQEFKKELDDLSARLGATSFGRAETIDPSLFRTIEYGLHVLFLSVVSRCCTPEVERYVPSSDESVPTLNTTAASALVQLVQL